jgi:HSP20 family protein
MGCSDRMLPVIRGDFRVDGSEHDDDVIIIGDLPVMEEDTISPQIPNPGTLEIRVNAKVRKREI